MSNSQLKMTLKTGEVKIQMFDEIAPQHVARIKELVSQGFYNGLKFHRVIDGFIAQTGCPNGDGTGRSGQNIPAELSDIPFSKGTIGMARGVELDSADCQFFICLQNCPRLKKQYTAWGKVVSGMEYIEAIKKGDNLTGVVNNPDEIIKLELI